MGLGLPFLRTDLQSIGSGSWGKMFETLIKFLLITCSWMCFYIAKLGYSGVYLFFLFLRQNIDCGDSLAPPRQGRSNMYPQSMF